MTHRKRLPSSLAFGALCLLLSAAAGASPERISTETATVDGLTWPEYAKPLVRIREILES